MTEQLIQGRRLMPEDLALLKGWCQDHPEWSRYRLSRQLAEHWNWRTPTGRLRDMAARHFLAKLQQRGLLELPARKSKGGRQAARWPAPPSRPATPICCGLDRLEPLVVELIPSRGDRARQLASTLAHYHYLGWRGPVGPHLAYEITDCQNRLLAVLMFTAAALKVAPRDEFIGWSVAQRLTRLEMLAQHSRFLLLPWVEVPTLASRVLGLVTRRLAADWQVRYQQSVVLVETFVEHQRFAGTCYRAANWRHVGRTAGRGRGDRENRCAQPSKDIYLYPLVRNWRRRLCA
jgi:hypothetical protein